MKSANEYRKHVRHADGLSSQCILCINEYKRSEKYKAQRRLVRKERYKKEPEFREKVKKRTENFRKSEFGKMYVINDHLKRRHNLSLDKYNKMFSEQNGCCDICQKHQSEFSKRLHVDHDHDTGEIRSLLCHHCNTALGGFREDIDLMTKAIEYLKKHSKIETNIRSIK